MSRPPDPAPADSPPSAISQPREKTKGKKPKDDLASFEQAKAAFFRRLWALIPRRMRWLAVALFFIGSGLAATYSSWYPVVDSWLHPPVQHVVIGVQIFLARDRVLAERAVELLNGKDEVVAMATTDANGFVTFNFTRNDRVAALRYQAQDGNTVSVGLDTRAVDAGRSLRVTLAEKKVEYEN